MSQVFRALSDPTRRRVLQLLQSGPMSAGELSAPSRLYIQSRSYQAELVQAIDKNSTPNR